MDITELGVGVPLLMCPLTSFHWSVRSLLCCTAPKLGPSVDELVDAGGIATIGIIIVLLQHAMLMIILYYLLLLCITC